MIDAQHEDFPEQEQFVDALLGLLSASETFVQALEHESTNDAECTDSPMVYFALGGISLIRTLRATLSRKDDATEPSESPDASENLSSVLESVLR